MSHIPIVTASVGQPLALSDISRVVDLADDHAIKFILETQIKEHYNLYGTEPYRLEYCRKKDGYQLRPNPVIGRLNCRSFILQISSKFREIEIGKWLQIAHYSGATSLVRHNNEIAEDGVSDNEKLEGIDYFFLSFVSSVYDCINQGLLYEKGAYEGDDPNFRGKLHVTKHIQKGANPMRLQTAQNIKEYDCNPNAVIKKSLEVCIAKSENPKLLSLANGLLPYFKDINTDRIDANIVDYDFVASLPRPDYEKALSLCKIILEGFTSIEGEENSFIPYYTINLDALFEKFVSFDIKRILKDQYVVHTQSKIQHQIIPELKDGFIVPDLLVYGNEKDQSRPVVIDTKNKYSMLDDSGAPKIANQDLFQMVYYCQTVGTNIAILVYPGDSDNYTKYPLMGSEGKSNYKNKRDAAVKAMFDTGNCRFTFNAALEAIHIIAWRLNLSGTLRDTRESVAQLSQFIADCVKQEVL
jgi:5-methylcytosine-specific restriction endonuclease McrBC regulatory subunit McrC